MKIIRDIIVLNFFYRLVFYFKVGRFWFFLRLGGGRFFSVVLLEVLSGG